MLLIEFPINGVTQYISDRILELTHQYKPYVVGFSAPSWDMAQEYGGMVKFGGGSITISNQLFKDLDVWPPPVQATVTVKYTATTEAAAITLFNNLAHLVSFTASEAMYDIRAPEWEDNLLDETVGYNNEDVTLPRAFGTVTHVNPVRLVDDGSSRPTYHLGGINTSTTAIRIIGITASGSSVIIETDGAHGFTDGNSIIIAGLDNYDGAHIISAASGTVFTIPESFQEETLPFNAQCYLEGALSVYDDGVSIPGNVILNGDGTFSLSASPVGQVTISGTGTYTTVSTVASWVKTKLGLGTYTNTNARTPSPSVSRWETSQQPTVDFLSKLCASFTHLFYIKLDTLTLVDMFKDNGSRVLTEYQFFKSPLYNKVNPLKKLTTSWQTFSAETGFVNDDYAGGQSHYIKTTDHEIEEPLFEYGNEVNVDIFHDTEADVRSALICIRSAYYEKDQASIAIPIAGDLPEPGEKISWADSSLPIDSPGYMRVVSIRYDFFNHEIKLSGPGFFIRPDRDSTIVDGSVSGASVATVDSFDMSLGKGCVWRYVIDDGSRTNMRMGRIQAVWNQAAGGAIEYMPDRYSDSIGDTSSVSISVDKSATIIRLRATSTSGTWTIKAVHTIIGASF